MHLEPAHRKLRDVVALCIFARFPDDTAHLLDHVVINLAEGVKALSSLVVVEGSSRSLREEKGARNFRVRGVVSVFIFLAAVSVFVRVLTAVTPSLAPALESIPFSTREVLLTRLLRSGACCPSHHANVVS
jgi:hypothetical protein